MNGSLAPMIEMWTEVEEGASFGSHDESNPTQIFYDG